MNYLSKNGWKFTVWYFDLALNGKLTERPRMISHVVTNRKGLPSSRYGKKIHYWKRVRFSQISFAKFLLMFHFLFWQNLYFTLKKTLTFSIHSSRGTWPTYHRQEKTIDMKITTHSGLSVASQFQLQFSLTSPRRQNLILFPRFSLRRISFSANVVRF